jgi:hypothetical protein
MIFILDLISLYIYSEFMCMWVLKSIMLFSLNYLFHQFNNKKKPHFQIL